MKSILARSCLPVVALVAGAAACSSAAVDAPFEPDPRSQFPGGETTNTLLAGVNSFNQPATTITDEHQGFFFSGNSFFNNSWVQAPASTESRDGLGPLFNARSCSGCHFKDGRGRPPAEDGDPIIEVLFRLNVGFDDDEAPIGDRNYGDQLQPLSIADVAPEATLEMTYSMRSVKLAGGKKVQLSMPEYQVTELSYGPLEDDAVLSPRVAPQMIGLGLLEAIRAEDLLLHADPGDEDDDGISGRARLVLDRSTGQRVPGRFGWKAEQPSVRQQVAGAFLGDIGITSELFPQQNCTSKQTDCSSALDGGEPEIDEKLLSRVELYSQLLAVPVRRDFGDPQVVQGEEIFVDLGCASCHVPSYQTGEHADLPEVSGQMIWPYTDLLLHDMGELLADSERGGLDAEWRTPPLWGLGLIHDVNGHQRLLHDGRANGVEEAIVWHGGEAEVSRQAYIDLEEHAREALVRFVNSL